MEETLKEVFCPCGCGMTIGQPMEFIDGQWWVYPVSEERLRQLAVAPHRKTRSQSHNLDSLPEICGSDLGVQSFHWTGLGRAYRSPFAAFFAFTGPYLHDEKYKADSVSETKSAGKLNRCYFSGFLGASLGGSGGFSKKAGRSGFKTCSRSIRCLP